MGYFLISYSAIGFSNIMVFYCNFKVTQRLKKYKIHFSPKTLQFQKQLNKKLILQVILTLYITFILWNCSLGNSTITCNNRSCNDYWHLVCTSGYSWWGLSSYWVSTTSLHQCFQSPYSSHNNYKLSSIIILSNGNWKI